MSDQTTGTLLRQQPLASVFSEDQITRLASIASKVHFERDQVIFDAGEDCSDFYLILSGRVALEMAPQATSLRADTLNGGDELGWSSLLQGRGKLSGARALIPVDALAFDCNRLRAMCERDPGFGYVLMSRLLGVVSQRLQATRLQVLDMYWPAAKRAGN